MNLQKEIYTGRLYAHTLCGLLTQIKLEIPQMLPVFSKNVQNYISQYKYRVI